MPVLIILTKHIAYDMQNPIRLWAFVATNNSPHLMLFANQENGVMQLPAALIDLPRQQSQWFYTK